MTAQQFIEKAIEGGWKPFPDERVHKKVEIDESGSWVVFTTKVNVRSRIVAEILLDPLAWQAVGKVERWDIGWQCDDCGARHICDGENCVAGGTHPYGFYRKAMYGLIDHLIGGGTIESYLATLK